MIPIHSVEVNHAGLNTTFTGVVHSLSTPEAPLHQFRGIKYASVPARFRQSKLVTSYRPSTDATRYGPICPQAKFPTMEEGLFALPEGDIPIQTFKQNEFECLNLNITSPGGLTATSRVPVMLWFHGGIDRGSGSNWVYDGGSFVRKSILDRKPVIMVTFNYRLGLFGFAANPLIREDNHAAGDEGVGNYGLRDQRKALEWVHRHIGAFGGDPHNITLFGESTGATDILNHMQSAANAKKPLFQRAIVQSAIADPNIPDAHGAGWRMSRIMASLRVSTLEQLRALPAEALVHSGQHYRAVDDGVFFRPGWEDSLIPERGPMEDTIEAHINRPCLHSHVSHHKDHSRPRSLSPHKSLSPSTHSPLRFSPPTNLQPLIIGDCGNESVLWSQAASLWTAPAVVRRLKAVVQSLSKTSNLLRAYDITSYTPADELVEKVLELINDTRVAWPTDVVAENAKRERGGKNVWRYVFDQEGPTRGMPHHAADLIYLFDNVPLPLTMTTSPPFEANDFYDDESSGKGTQEMEDVKMHIDDLTGLDDEVFAEMCSSSTSDPIGYHDEWMIPAVDEWSFNRVRDAIQEKWIAFAYGEAPWKEDKVFVFGPEGETGERSLLIFEGRRRRAVWRGVLEPVGVELVQKVGVELSNGPPMGMKH